MNHLRLIFMLSFMSFTVNSFNEKAISRVKTIASENHCYIKFIKGFCILSSTKNLPKSLAVTICFRGFRG